MIYLYIIFLTVWIAYNLAIYNRFGLLGSVSESHYKLVESNPKLGFVFTIFSWSYAIPACVMATTGLMFFAAGLICFVGVAANYRNDGLDGIWHGRFAKAAVALSQLSIIFDYHLYLLSLLSIGAMVAIYFVKPIKNKTYWIEQVAYFAIAYTLLLTI